MGKTQQQSEHVSRELDGLTIDLIDDAYAKWFCVPIVKRVIVNSNG